MGLIQSIGDAIWKEFWPKGLVGLIVPALQFAWNFYHKQGREHRIKTLRQEITELEKFVALGNSAALSTMDASLELARKELDEKRVALNALAVLTRREIAAVASASGTAIQPDKTSSVF